MAFFRGPSVVLDGLVLYLDAANPESYSGTGSTWFDVSGNGNNGTLTNGPTFDSDNLGSIVFDGSNDFVDCGNPPTLSLGSQGTIIVLIKTNRSYPSNTGDFAFRGIIGKVIGGGGGQQSYWLDWFGTNSSRTLRFGVGDSGGSTQASVSFDFSNKWAHVLGRWNGSVAELYVNGILRSSIANSRIAQTISNPLRIGSVFGNWEGEIAYSQIYNRALTPQEILQNYNATKTRFGLS
jgi:hypothetical protein